MIGVNTIKAVKQLQQKKLREQENLFIVEGEKNCLELISSQFEVKTLYVNKAQIKRGIILENTYTEVSTKEMARISGLKTPSSVLAVVKTPPRKKEITLTGNRYLALDSLNDPGNMGTLIRLADWFGLDGIVCSENSVDCFNPKVIQASMGSVFRVNVIYTDLEKTLKNSSDYTKIGMEMKGENIHAFSWPQKSILVMGSESHGVSELVQKTLSKSITIPRFGDAESLNVATAAAIGLSEWRRG